MTPRELPAQIELSVVVPVHDEEESVAALIEEIVAALRGRVGFEVLFVDDGSLDTTAAKLRHALDFYPELRVLRHRQRSGQSTAVRSGVKAARGEWIATLDGDGQNDPADLPKLLDARARAAADVRLFAGWRTRRSDSGRRRWASRLANALRARLLRDDTPDSGCGIKLFERSAFLDLPSFEHMHRFLPALFRRAGWRSVNVPVRDRPRNGGVSKYGTLQRALVGVADLHGVYWLMRRGRRIQVEVEEIRR